MNSSIILLSVLAWFRLYQARPSVSMAAMRARRGVTVRSRTELVWFLGDHFFRKKVVSLTHDSSMLTILYPSCSKLMRAIAYCYRRTTQRSLFSWTGWVTTLRKLIPILRFIMFRMSGRLNAIPKAVLTLS